ncbi:MAG: hypothetical protein H8E62_00355 [Planctomycetes bacterium]|nr:hypothetical protein [Planctomycetota bacterium]
MSQEVKSASICRCKHKGNTIVLLIIVALFAVVAVFFLNVATGDPVGPVEQCPWVESNRIVNSYSEINLPQSPQITFDKLKKMSFKITSEEGEGRGRLDIEITPEGMVTAVWKATYKEGIYEKEFSASCMGNVDATRIYEDEDGMDESKLFFITEGRFLLQAFKQGNARVGGGEAYIVGWVSPDGSAKGTLVLAPDKKNTKIYAWGE